MTNENTNLDSKESIKIEIPSDSRAIWAVERFFLFSFVLTVFKIYVTILAGDYQSLAVISIDAVIDLIVSGLGIYLIQLQQKVFKKVNKGTQEIKVDEKGVLVIASIQGLIFLIGGITVFIQSIVKIVQRNQQYGAPTPPSSFNVLSGLILAGIISLNYFMYAKTKEDSIAIDNVALKSITANLLIDIIVTVFAWIILLLTPYFPVVWLIFDPLVGIFIGIWMIITGLQYLKPGLREIAIYAEEAQRKYNTDNE